MAHILFWLLFSSVVNAASYTNSSSSTKKEYYNYPHTAADLQFIDCTSYSSAHNISRTRAVFTSTALVEDFGPVPFEEYWCNYWAGQNANTPDSFPGSQGSPYFWNLSDTVKSHCLSLEAENYTSWAAHPQTNSVVDGNFTESVFWQPVLTQPCCNTYCNLEAASAQLLYWPTPAPNPNISTIVSNDYTFISPSVYVVYKDVAAYGQCGKIGPTSSTVTIGYDPTDVKSYPTSDTNGPQPIDYRMLWSNCTGAAPNPTATSFDGPPCLTVASQIYQGWCNSSESTWYSSNMMQQAHCNPYLSYPPSSHLQAANPAWATCDSDPVGGHQVMLFDPPRTLAPKAAMAPTPTPDPKPAASAEPASSAAGAGPSKTPPPNAAPAISVGSSPPSSPADPAPSIDSPNKSPPDPSPVNSPPTDNNPKQDPPNPDTVNPSPPKNSPIDAPSNPDPANSSPAQKSPNNAAPKANSADPGLLQTPTVAGPPNPNSENSRPSENPNAQNPQANNDPNKDPGASPGVQSNAAQSPTPSSPTEDPAQSPPNQNQNQNQNQPDQNLQPFQPNSPNPPAAATPLSTNIQGYAIQASPSPGVVVVDGNSITRGADPAVISSTPIALHSNGNLLLGSSTVEIVLPSPAPLATPAPVFSVGSQVLTYSSDQIVGAGTTIGHNDPGITIEGTPVSLAPSSLHIGASAVALAQAPTLGPQPSTFAVGNQVLTLSSNNILAPETTLKPNDPALTIDGTPISHASSALQIGTSVVALAPSPTEPPFAFSVGNQVLTLSSNNIVASGTTLKPNDPALTIDGTPVYHASSALQIGTSTIALAPTPAPALSTFSVGSQLLTLSSGNILAAGTTVKPNGPGITIDGTPVSIAPSALQIGASTIAITPAPIPTPSVFSVGSQLLTFASGNIIAGESTMKPNDSPITINGTPISLASSALQIGTSTIPLSPSPTPSAFVLTANSQAYTATPLTDGGGLVIAGSTLQPGQSAAITISGTPVSALGSSAVVIGSSTVSFSLPPEGTTAAPGLGGFIFSGLGGGPVGQQGSGSGSGSVTATAGVNATTGVNSSGSASATGLLRTSITSSSGGGVSSTGGPALVTTSQTGGDRKIWVDWSVCMAIITMGGMSAWLGLLY